MNRHDTAINHDDPFEVLGVGQTATEIEIRQRYLELIKLHPPEREPERFRKIHEAYEFAKNPLRLAERLLEFSPRFPEWDELIESQKKRHPTLSTAQMLALGNRSAKTPNVDNSSECQASECQASECQASESQASECQTSESQTE